MSRKTAEIPSITVPDNDAGETPCFEDMIVAIAEHQDKDSFIQLFEHFAPRVKSFMMRGGTSPELADELAQETMLAVWHKAGSYNPAKAAASTWIFTIARNKKIDALRKSSRFEVSPDDPAFVEDDSPSQAEALMHADETAAIATALETLPEEQAELIQKSFFEDKSHSQIAEETGVPLGTIKSRIRLALQRLRKQEGIKQLW